MIEHRPSDLLNTHFQKHDSDGDGNSSSTYSIQNRQGIVTEIKQALASCEFQNIANDFDKLQGLCELSIKENESMEKKTYFADLALCYVDTLKQHVQLLESSQSLGASNQEALSTIASDLSQIACENYEQLLSYSEDCDN
jgi:hypothetical protein